MSWLLTPSSTTLQISLKCNDFNSIFDASCVKNFLKRSKVFIRILLKLGVSDIQTIPTKYTYKCQLLRGSIWVQVASVRPPNASQQAMRVVWCCSFKNGAKFPILGSFSIINTELFLTKLLIYKNGNETKEKFVSESDNRKNISLLCVRQNGCTSLGPWVCYVGNENLPDFQCVTGFMNVQWNLRPRTRSVLEDCSKTELVKDRINFSI